MLQDVGLGILNWKCYETLRASLDSHKRGGLLELFDEKIIFFQEIDDEARAIAKQYGFEAHGNEKNTGIYGGFVGLANALQSKYVLLLENDWQLIKPFAQTQRQLSDAANLLRSGRAIKVTFRQRHNVVEKNKDIEKFKDFEKLFLPLDSNFSTRLRALFYQIIFYRKTRGLLNAAMFHMQRPQDYFSFVEYDEKIDFFFCPSKYRRWSNQVFMIERVFFINEILARAGQTYAPKKTLVNGFRAIEKEMTIGHRHIAPPLRYILHRKPFVRSWWSKQNFKIATSNSGLFAHARIGYRGY